MISPWATGDIAVISSSLNASLVLLSQRRPGGTAQPAPRPGVIVLPAVRPAVMPLPVAPPAADTGQNAQNGVQPCAEPFLDVHLDVHLVQSNA